MTTHVIIWRPRWFGDVFDPSSHDFETETKALTFARNVIRKETGAHATVTQGGHLVATVVYVPAKTIDWRGIVGRVMVRRSKRR